LIWSPNHRNGDGAGYGCECEEGEQISQAELKTAFAIGFHRLIIPDRDQPEQGTLGGR
jgi:hypothetical protein